jgi:hypothetical protein
MVIESGDGIDARLGAMWVQNVGDILTWEFLQLDSLDEVKWLRLPGLSLL